jgi:putative peptide zinc metalloprotease protein
MIGAIVLLPRLMTSAWDSGSRIVSGIPRDADHGQILDLLAALVSLVALVLPVLGSVLVTQKIARTTTMRAKTWSDGRPVRRALVLVGAAAAIAGMIWAWWPAGQYRPIRANQRGTLAGLVQLVSAPAAVARPAAVTPPVQVTPGTHLALSMIPVGGATKRHPALFIILGKKGKPPVAIYSTTAPAPPASTPTATTSDSTSAGTPATSGSSTTAPAPSSNSPATAFPFKLPSAPGPGGTQAMAVNTQDGGVKYDVAYSLVTVRGGAPVTNTNSAYALAHCQACTTVAVSFQVVLIIGTSKLITPVNAAGAVNYDCPACTTTAIADQIVITLKSQPSKALMAQLEQALKQLNALPALGAGGTPTVVANQVAAVQQQVLTELNQSGLVANPPKNTTTTGSSSTASPGSSTTTSSGVVAPGSASSSGGSTSSGSPSTSSSGSAAAPAQGSTTTTTSSASPPTTTTSSSTTTTTPSSSTP